MKRKSWLSIILMTALLCSWAIGGLAQEGVLTLPENLTKIEDEAFAGNTSLGEVVLPEGIETIGSRAFAGSTVSVINLPASITSIADDAFDGCGAMEVSAQEGSYAYDWAVEKGHSILKPATPASSFAYSIANEEVTITAFVGDETEVMIPRSIEGYPVTSIGDSAFKDRSDLTSVSIPDGVTSIGGTAFRGCSSLTSIELPDSITSIGSSAFYRCSSLMSIKLPDGVTSIGYSAFYGCRSLTSIELPDSVTSIGDWAFSYCSGLTSIELPDSVTNIGYRAFYECSGLTSIELPDGVTSIGEYAFYECSGLTSINIPDGVTSIGEWAFSGCISLTSIELPEGVTSIGEGAFYGCSSVTSIELPEGVTSVGDSTFYGCSNLMGISIPDGVTNIGEYAFEGCSSLTSIMIPDSVTSIGGYAFSRCGSLTSINIPDGVTSIGAYTFYGCSSLTSIELPDSVTSIGGTAFRGCSSLTSINIPDGVTSIGEDAFRGCSNLTSINIPDGVTHIDRYAFYNCSSLMSVTLPDSLTSIGYWAFSYCSGLMNITLPDSVTSIDECAFYFCSNLTSIKLSGSLKSIGKGAFDCCSGLTSISIPDGVTSIGDTAFCGCNGLISVSIPDSVASIGESAFRYCRNLMSISIPESVTSIGNYAFDSCDNLTLYGVSGSYAETYAIDNDIPFIAGEMPKVFPTLTDFTLNATPTELTVPVGSQLVFGGMINAGSAQLVDVQASVFLASDHEQGAVYEREEDINADTYDLSRLSPMTVGAEYNGFAMTAGNSYDVMLYVTDGNGRGFESDPYIRVHVVEAEAHEHVPSTTEAATYLFHVFETIDNDNQNHNVSAIMWDVPCAVCGEVYMYKDEVGYEGDSVPRTEAHTYSADGYCTACGYVCVHNFVDTGEEKKYTGVWKDCGDGTHERLSLMKYFECTYCDMRELRRVVEENFIPEEHLLNTEERRISVEQLPDDDSKRVLQHQMTVEKWEYCETRAYGCTYRNLLSTETRNVEHQFVDGVCECGHVQQVIGNREDLLEGVNWELVYYVEHIIEDDTQFASAIGNLFNRGVDEVMGYLWNIANFDVFGLAEHIWEDVNYAYREEAAMSIIESLAGYGYSEKDLADAFYLLAVAIDLGADISDLTFDSVEKLLKKWDPNGVEAEAQSVFDKIGIMNSVNGLISDVIKDGSLNANQRATLMLLLSDYDANYAYLFRERRSAEINNDDELYAIYDIALTKLEEVYKNRAKVYIANPVECLSFDTFISGVELALEIKGIDSPIEYGLGKLSAKTGGTENLAKGAKIALVVHTCVSFVAGEALGGNDIYDAQQKMYDNLTVLEPMQKQLLSAKQTYINEPIETNMNILANRAMSVAKYKQKTLDNVWQYRDAQWFTSVNESSINREKSNLAIYAEGVTAINNGQAYEPTNAVPAANGVKHGETCPVCALK